MVVILCCNYFVQLTSMDRGAVHAGRAAQSRACRACCTEPGMPGVLHRAGHAGRAAQSWACRACCTEPGMPGVLHRAGHVCICLRVQPHSSREIWLYHEVKVSTWFTLPRAECLELLCVTSLPFLYSKYLGHTLWESYQIFSQHFTRWGNCGAAWKLS
jgi:hypothetical protein